MPNSSRWWEVLWSLSSRHRKQQVIPTTSPSFTSPLYTLQVTGADFFYGSTITKYLKVSLSLSLCKLLVYSNTTEALNPDLLNKKEMVYCDLTLKLLRCQAEMWIRKSRRKDILNASWHMYICWGEMYLFKHWCCYISTSTKANKYYTWILLPCFLCIIFATFFLSWKGAKLK